jgi:hypothetical protein
MQNAGIVRVQFPTKDNPKADYSRTAGPVAKNGKEPVRCVRAYVSAWFS